MTQLNPRQTAQAVILGKLVNVAYTMYGPLPAIHCRRRRRRHERDLSSSPGCR